MKTKRNYQFVQFLLDFFALFQLYLLLACIVDIFRQSYDFNSIITASGGEAVKMNPVPVIIWGILSLIVFLTALILPFIYVKKTKMNQKQFDMWVYAVYLTRILALLIVFYMMDIHASYIQYNPNSIFDFGIIGSVVLIAILIRFTQIRIRAAEPKRTEEKERSIVED